MAEKKKKTVAKKKKVSLRKKKKQIRRRPRHQAVRDPIGVEGDRKPNKVALDRLNGLLQLIAIQASANPDDFSSEILSIDVDRLDPEKLLNSVKNVFDESPYLKQLTATERDRKKALYLKKFAESGRNDLACRAAGVDSDTFYVWKRQDKEFARNFEIAKEVMLQHMEDAAYRRGIHGVVKPIYQGGKLVGYERKFSDPMLTTLLKGNSSKYKDGVADGGGEAQPYKGRGLSKEGADELKAKILGIPTKQKKGGAK